MIQTTNPNSGRKQSFKPTTKKELETNIQALSDHPSWSKMTLRKRLGYLRKFNRYLQLEKTDIAMTLSNEIGKPLWESHSEIMATLAKLDSTIMALQYRTKYPEIISGSKQIQTEVKPIGLIGVIGPFNFPIHIPNGQIMPALITGNTVIVKSSEYAVKTTRCIEAIWKKVFNDIQSPIAFCYGNAIIGEAIVKHKKTKAIFFTGSTNVGRAIETECIKTNTLCALEMGGNNALVVDTYNQHIVDHIIHSALITSGQRCSCARRIIINKDHHELIPELIDRIKSLTISSLPATKDPFMGPIVLPEIKNELLTQSFKQSETLLKSSNLGPGGLISPRIEITDQAPDIEYFGPLFFIELSNSFEDAIIRANKTNYGLTCSVYTSSKKKFNTALSEIQCGVINWNTPTTGASGQAPFGGLKDSGNHRPAGFNMIDHCITPVATSLQKKAPPLKYPGGH